MNDGKSMDAARVAELFAALRSAVASAVIGQDEAVRLSFVTLLCSGHSLYEGVPGWPRPCWFARWRQPSASASAASNAPPIFCRAI
jgi:hypothetical protein